MGIHTQIPGISKPQSGKRLSHVLDRMPGHMRDALVALIKEDAKEWNTIKQLLKQKIRALRTSDKKVWADVIVKEKKFLSSIN